MIAATLGGLLVGAARGRSRSDRVAALLGLALIGYAASDSVRRNVVRAGVARRRIRLRTSLDIKRPMAQVFAFCKDFENFPRVIGALQRVIDYQDGRSHWEAFGPSGSVVAWDALVTKYVPNSVIAWQTVAGGDVDCQGVLRFTPIESGTRVTLDLTYAPQHTGMGEALRALAARSRQAQLETDLTHVAFYLESLEPLEPLALLQHASCDVPAESAKEPNA